MGAGVLPVAIHPPTGQLIFLMGQEQDDHQWSDFGGGTQKKETPLQTAIREGCEELSGFFGTPTELKHLVQSQLLTTLTVNTTYTTFLFEVPYDPELPFYFRNNHQFIKAHLPAQVGQDGLYEKCAIQWFTLAELKAKRKTFRPFYRHVIDAILAWRGPAPPPPKKISPPK